jgi:hypothetical protein
MGESQPNTEQVLLRLPKSMLDALIRRAAEVSFRRVEKVTIQTLIKEMIAESLQEKLPR